MDGSLAGRHFCYGSAWVVHYFSVTVFYDVLVASKNRFSSGSLAEPSALFHKYGIAQFFSSLRE